MARLYRAGDEDNNDQFELLVEDGKAKEEESAGRVPDVSKLRPRNARVVGEASYHR